MTRCGQRSIGCRQWLAGGGRQCSRAQRPAARLTPTPSHVQHPSSKACLTTRAVPRAGRAGAAQRAAVGRPHTAERRAVCSVAPAAHAEIGVGKWVSGGWRHRRGPARGEGVGGAAHSPWVAARLAIVVGLVGCAIGAGRRKLAAAGKAVRGAGGAGRPAVLATAAGCVCTARMRADRVNWAALRSMATMQPLAGHPCCLRIARQVSGCLHCTASCSPPA